MPDILNIAVSGLLTYQRSLSTTSHNIANVNTPGYSRQSAQLEAQVPISLAKTFYGSGVAVEQVQRSYNQFLTREVRDTTSAHASAFRFSELAGHIDDLLADPDGGISPVLHGFFEAVQDVADDPASTTARYAMIGAADSLTARFDSIDQRLTDLTRNTAADLADLVDEINNLVIGIRDINSALHDSYSSGPPTQQAADLLDQRDHLLDELAQRVDINIIREQENYLTIFIGNGQTVLTGESAFGLSVVPDVADPTQDVIVYNGLNVNVDMSTQVSGGELGGLLDFRRNVLVPTRNALGRTAIGLAETVNAQMRDGMDLNGNLGQDFFSYRAPQSIAYTSNTGSATVAAAVSDVTGLTADDYLLAFDGANWTLTSDSGSSATVANGAPATLVFEGLTLTIDGATAVAGDRFTIKPTLAGAGSLAVANRDPLEIAAALPIRTSASLANLGAVEISAGVVTDVTDPGLLATATLTFDNPATTLRADVAVVVGGTAYAAGAAIPWTDNMQIDANGWQVSLSGTPQPGDVFTVEANTGGSGDNRNALNLAGLQTTAIFDGASATYQEDYATLVGFVGARTLSAQVERDSQQALKLQAIDRKSSETAVNLDEEAADLIRFQQAYEANAQVISTVKVLFDTLIAATR